MAGINLLVTGLAIGAETSDICQVCNYDYDWLINKPSNLIVADKIIMSKYIYETIQNEQPGENNLSKSIKKVIEVAEDFDLIEIKSPNNVITKDKAEKISEEVAFDTEALLNLFPKSIKRGDKDVPGQIIIEDYEFCFPRIWSIYASLILAKEWNAESLFSENVYTFCKYKFGLSSIDQKNKKAISAFDNIFSTQLPEKSIFPLYSFHDVRNVKCNQCKKLERCGNEYLKDVEKLTHEYLELRDYDEIEQIKQVISEIVSKLEKGNSTYSHDDIFSEFNSEQSKIKRNLSKKYPKYERWANISIVASTPFLLVGNLTGLPLLSYIGTSLVGASGVTKSILEYSKSKYKWVGFLNSSKNK